MPRRAARRCLTLTLACAAAWAAPGAAQVSGGVDAAGAVVKYDGYLVSSAFALAPSVSWATPRTTLAASASFLLFQSGNTSVQGLATATAFSAPQGPLRVEALAEAGGSAYGRYASFAHLLGGVRLHLLYESWGLWAGPTAGDVSRGAGGRGALGYAAGWWARAAAGAVQVTWTRVTVIDTAFGDLRGRVAWRSGPLDLEGSAGRRFTSRGGSSGGYGEVSASWRLSPSIALIASAGGYPSDPVSGTIAGRYVTLGLRLSREAGRPKSAVPLRRAPPLTGERKRPGAIAGAVMVLEPDSAGSPLVVRAPGAGRVEVMGDFTAWQPIVLAEAGHGLFRYATPLPPGLYRFNVRVDGGPWGVPQGAAATADEFGGTVGLLAIR